MDFYTCCRHLPLAYIDVIYVGWLLHSGTAWCPWRLSLLEGAILSSDSSLLTPYYVLLIITVWCVHNDLWTCYSQINYRYTGDSYCLHLLDLPRCQYQHYTRPHIHAVPNNLTLVSFFPLFSWKTAMSRIKPLGWPSSSSRSNEICNSWSNSSLGSSRIRYPATLFCSAFGDNLLDHFQKLTCNFLQLHVLKRFLPSVANEFVGNSKENNSQAIVLVTLHPSHTSSNSSQISH